MIGDLNKVLVFNHIPKTAGSTILNVLSRQYSKDEMYSINAMDFANSLKDFNELSKSKKSKIKCVSGHGACLLIDQLDKPYEIVTFLRDPNDTLLSSYFYIKRASWNKYHKEVLKMKSIIDFVEFRCSNNMDNQQTRYLANDLDHLILNNNPIKEVDELIYNQALENLSQTKYVYTTEDFNVSVYDLYRKLQWSKYPLYLSLNKTQNRKSLTNLTDKEIEAVNSCNKFDKMLYSKVVSNTFNNKSEEGLFYSLRLSYFQLLNSVYSKVKK